MQFNPKLQWMSRARLIYVYKVGISQHTTNTKSADTAESMLRLLCLVAQEASHRQWWNETMLASIHT